MAEAVDFLQPDKEQIRHQIRGILDSYNHEWDVLAELCQNAIDAITRRTPSRGHISLVVDAVTKSIEIEDNGTGIDPDQLVKLLRPFASDKGLQPNQIGQKGVGLSFVVFTSCKFELESRHEKGTRRATVLDAATWVNAKDDAPLLLHISELTPTQGETGVTIRMTLNDPDHPVFGLTRDQIEFALRTRTAVGNTSHIWGTPYKGDVSFRHRALDGEFRESTFDCKYLLPTEGVPPSAVITLEEWQEWNREADRSDSEKRRKLKDRVIVTSGNDQRPGRTNRYWACLVPDRATWKTLSKYHRTLTATEEIEDKNGDVDESPYVFGGGLYVSTKGMPTGIKIDLPARGSAGYMPNYFILIEDPSLNFDIGRKYIPGRLQGVLKEKAYDQFREYINSVMKYISGSVDEPNARWARDENFAEIDELPDLTSQVSQFVKRPNSQEATVAAMFFELLGKGEISNFRPLISGYKGKYDLYAMWNKRKIVLEFKYDLYALLKDFSDERKLFDEIDILVAWEITERDRKEVARRGLTLEPVAPSVLGPVNQHFPHATYELRFPGASPLQIVTMKKVVSPED